MVPAEALRGRGKGNGHLVREEVGSLPRNLTWLPLRLLTPAIRLYFTLEKASFHYYTNPCSILSGTTWLKNSRCSEHGYLGLPDFCVISKRRTYLNFITIQRMILLCNYIPNISWEISYLINILKTSFLKI